MADIVIITSLFMVVALELAAQAGAVYFAYRLTRLTGSFRAWTLIITAFILTTASSVIGLIFLLAINPDQLVSLVQSIGFGTTILSDAVTVAAAFLLFFGMFDLVRRFKHTAKKPDQPSPSR